MEPQKKSKIVEDALAATKRSDEMADARNGKPKYDRGHRSNPFFVSEE